nr:DNA polymerase III subunit [Dissulfurirhabdus thermomarina]
MLSRILRRDLLAHAYLVTGPGEDRREALAAGFAGVLLCRSPGLDEAGPAPCGTCPACGKFRRRTHPDFLEVRPDGAMIRIDQVRALCAALAFAPLEGERRVCLVHGAHRMNPEAANAFLKTLEEPPAGTFFLLTAPTARSVLSTIASRCQPVRTRAARPAETAAGLPGEPGAALAAAVLADGDPERAAAYLAPPVAEMRRRLLDAVSAEAPADPARLLELAAGLAEDREQLAAALGVMRALVRDLLLVQGGGGVSDLELANPDFAAAVRSVAARRDAADLAAFSAWLDRAEVWLERNVAPDFLAEGMLLAWWGAGAA